ncbi:MAG TPA: hypothetical protein PLK94_01165 [Alphaproteobacteria bacterium]|nr:hypothetical protein [Alphaproteobacteria bacterium]
MKTESQVEYEIRYVSADTKVQTNFIPWSLTPEEVARNLARIFAEGAIRLLSMAEEGTKKFS